jgi:elongator complex protein 1
MNMAPGVSHSVGWGKKETQFHGSEGKAAAQRKVDVNRYTTSSDDDQQPRISWRGDGSFYVMSSVDMSKGTQCRLHKDFDSILYLCLV